MRFLNNKNMMSAQDAAVKNAVEAEIRKFTNEINDIKERLESVENAQAAIPTSIETENLSADDVHADNVYAKNVSVEEDVSIQGNVNAAKVTTPEVDTQDVKTNKVTATQEVKAPKGDFAEADIGELKAETLNLDTFNVGELNATKVDATTVEAENADITDAEITNATVGSETVETLNVTDKVTGKDAEFTGNVTEKNTEIENLQVTGKADLAETEIETIKTGRIFVDPEKLQLIPENGWLHIHHISQGEFFIYLSDFTDITTQISEFGNILFSGILEYRNHDKVANVRMSYGQKVKAFEEVYIDSNGEIWLKRGSAVADSRRVIILAVTEDDVVIDTWAEDAATFDVSTAKIIELETGNETIHKGEFYQDGNAVIHGNLKVEGQIELEGLEAEHAEYLGTSDKVTADDNGNLSVDGDATISGDTAVGGKLDVTGDADIGGDATVAGDMTVTGDLHATADKAKADENGVPFSAFLNKNIGMYYDLVVHDEVTLAAFVEAPNNYKNVLFMPAETSWDLSSIPTSVTVTANLTGWRGGELSYGDYSEINQTGIKLASGCKFTGLISNFNIRCETTITTSNLFLKNCSSWAFGSFVGMHAEDCEFTGINPGFTFSLDNAVLKRNTFTFNGSSSFSNISVTNATIIDNDFTFTYMGAFNATIKNGFKEMHGNTFSSYRITLTNDTEYTDETFNLVGGGYISFNAVKLVNCKIIGNNDFTNISSYQNDSSPSSSFNKKPGLYNCKIDVGYIYGAYYFNCDIHLKRVSSDSLINKSKLYSCNITCDELNDTCPYFNDSEFITCRIHTQAGSNNYMFRNCSLINNEIVADITKINSSASSFSGVHIDNSTIGKTAHIRGNRFILTYNSSLINLYPVFKINAGYNVRDNVISIIASNAVVTIAAADTLVNSYADCGTTAAGYDAQSSGNNFIERKTA